MNLNERLISNDKIEMLGLNHQRNGISGEPFYVVRFNLKEEKELGELVAIVPVFAISNNDATNIFVINVADLSASFRGDFIGTELLKLMIKINSED